MALNYSKKYSRAQRSAFESGKGYAVAHAKKGINFDKPELRSSFAQGYARGNAMIARNPSKYPSLKSSRKRKSK